MHAGISDVVNLIFFLIIYFDWRWRRNYLIRERIIIDRIQERDMLYRVMLHGEEKL